MKVVIYARVSSKEQAEGYSIPAQLKRIREFCAERKYPIIKEFAEVETAKKAGRVVFGEMIRFVKENGQVEGIVCHKVDRLCRNFKDYVTMDELKVKAVFVEEEFPDNAAGKLTFGLKVLLAKHYIDNLSDEVKKGVQEKCEQGHWPSVAPIGYKNNFQTHLIEIDSERTPLVHQLFEWYATGRYSLEDIVEKAEETGLRTPQHGFPVNKAGIYRVLRNPIYYGVFIWKGKRYQGKHQPIIPFELFDRVQTVFAIQENPRGETREFAFRGLVKCARCGCNFTAEIKKGKYVYYHCTHHRGDCGNAYITEVELSTLLGGVLKGIEVNEPVVEMVQKALKESQEDKRRFHTEALRRLQNQYNLLQAKMEKAYEDKLDGAISDELWLKKSAQWEVEIERTRIQMERYEKANVSYYEEGLRILELCQKAHSLYVKQNPFEQRKLLDCVVSNCTIDAGTLSPTYRKPFDSIAKRVEMNDWRGRRDSNSRPPA